MTRNETRPRQAPSLSSSPSNPLQCEPHVFRRVTADLISELFNSDMISFEQSETSHLLWKLIKIRVKN